MKLHLPLPLRSALLAVCAVGMVNFTTAPAFSQTSTTFGNPYTGSETLTEDLIYTDGEFELRFDKHPMREK